MATAPNDVTPTPDAAPAATSLLSEAAATPAADPAPADPAPADPAPADPAPAADDATPADPAPAPADPAPEGDGKPAEPDGDDDDKPQGAPEEYTFEAPEGTELDADAIEAFTPIAKELNLTNEQAQQLVNLQAQQSAAWQENLQNHILSQQAEWREATQNDTEIGGEKLNENLAVAVKARDAFGTDALKTLLDDTGLGNHPEVIRFFTKVGKGMGEHAIVNAGKPHREVSFYDHPTSKTG